ncbi:hypothetical protein U9M48_007316 [Paspalum notatum var. saurae]|uniref:WRKY domain-containing protein n=1 Tax=Paspalum notatum var. saurae TaxID=547442 RepID=A0AAQ3SGY0_PASNO
MASSGGDVPAQIRTSAAVSDLIVAHDGVVTLRTFLLQLDHQRAPWAQQVIEDVLSRVSSAMSVLGVTSGGAAPKGRSPAAGSDAARPQQSVSSCGNKRKQSGSSSRRSHRLCDKKITSTLEDGHVWRKYGQKEIQNSPHPRSYYRCTHKSDQGCGAKRYVQRCDNDPSKHVVTYYGEHTCRDPSTIPLIVPAAAGDHRANNLISFGPANNAAASTVASSSQAYLATMGGSTAAAEQQLSTSWCTSDDVFSSSAGSFMQVDELIGAVVGSAGLISSVADHRGRLGGVAGGGGTASASFPPSPNESLGFVVGSFGSIAGGDDDDGMFALDP